MNDFIGKFQAWPIALRIALVYFVTFTLGFVLMFGFSSVINLLLTLTFLGSIGLIVLGFMNGYFNNLTP